MTSEQAIKILKNLQIEFNENWLDDSVVNEAFNLAFEALESQAFAYKIAGAREVKHQEDLNKIKFEQCQYER